MLEGAGQYLQNVSKNCKDLNGLENKFRKDMGMPAIPNNIYSTLEILSTQYAQQFSKQAKTFRTQIYSAFKYESLYMLNMM